MKTYKTIIIFFLTTITLLAGAQNAEQNFFKYWKYRDRLKYFVVPGYNKGESTIAAMRNRFGEAAGDDAQIKNIDFYQHGVVFGYYLGMLATEYKVLSNNGQTASAQNTQNEINAALNQLKNRFDETKLMKHSI